MSFIALDTEFVWQRTYYANLGLVQVGLAEDFDSTRLPSAPPAALAFPAATPERRAVRLLDPLHCDPATVGALLRDASLVKILHDAVQDLQHLVRWCGGVLPVNVFDTRIAAGFCGMPSTVSLRQLLQEVVGIELPKTQTRTNWMRRPLSPDQLEYAADDVAYLGAARAWLLAKATALGTLGWMLEEMRVLDDPAHYAESCVRDAWRRVKVPVRAFRLPRQLVRLRELAAWREETARSRNLPRSWVLDDKVLVAAALNPPGGPSAIPKQDLSRAFVAGFFDTLAVAETLPEEGLPDLGDTATPGVREMATTLLKTLAEVAAEAHIDPALLGSRADAIQFCQNPDDPAHPLNRGWRAALAGKLARNIIKPEGCLL
ncbi:MAG: ribonuclease D [Kiritimatiellia bacterium]|jgi:ribonuclease D